MKNSTKKNSIKKSSVEVFGWPKRAGVKGDSSTAGVEPGSVKVQADDFLPTSRRDY